jgi:hypothetical protein
MAKRYITTDNSRGKPVTASDLTFAHIRGWDAGVRIEADISDPTGNTWRVYMTGGSNRAGQTVFLGTVTDTPDGPEFVPNGRYFTNDRSNRPI